ncbi:MAG: HAD family phosphatase [Vicingaceae bacterium]
MKIKEQFPSVTAIIFDLGNVIINLDMPATDRAFSKLLGSKYETVMMQLNEKNIFQRYEKGEISSTLFVQSIADASSLSDLQAIKAAWNAMLLDIPTVRFEILRQAKKKYRTFCLSNTNELHIDFIYNQLEQEQKLNNLDEFFEKVYLSHEMGMRKPDEEIFLKVIEEQQLNPHNTLFIDDTAGHLESARKIGLQTLHMTDGLSLEQLF